MDSLHGNPTHHRVRSSIHVIHPTTKANSAPQEYEYRFVSLGLNNGSSVPPLPAAFPKPLTAAAAVASPRPRTSQHHRTRTQPTIAQRNDQVYSSLSQRQHATPSPAPLFTSPYSLSNYSASTVLSPSAVRVASVAPTLKRFPHLQLDAGKFRRLFPMLSMEDVVTELGRVQAREAHRGPANDQQQAMIEKALQFLAEAVERKKRWQQDSSVNVPTLDLSILTRPTTSTASPVAPSYAPSRASTSYGSRSSRMHQVTNYQSFETPVSARPSLTTPVQPSPSTIPVSATPSPFPRAGPAVYRNSRFANHQSQYTASQPQPQPSTAWPTPRAVDESARADVWRRDPDEKESSPLGFSNSHQQTPVPPPTNAPAPNARRFLPKITAKNIVQSPLSNINSQKLSRPIKQPILHPPPSNEIAGSKLPLVQLLEYLQSPNSPFLNNIALEQSMVEPFPVRTLLVQQWTLQDMQWLYSFTGLNSFEGVQNAVSTLIGMHHHFGDECAAIYESSFQSLYSFGRALRFATVFSKAAAFGNASDDFGYVERTQMLLQDIFQAIQQQQVNNASRVTNGRRAVAKQSELASTFDPKQLSIEHILSVLEEVCFVRGGFLQIDDGSNEATVIPPPSSAVSFLDIHPLLELVHDRILSCDPLARRFANLSELSLSLQCELVFGPHHRMHLLSYYFPLDASNNLQVDSSRPQEQQRLDSLHRLLDFHSMHGERMCQQAEQINQELSAENRSINDLNLLASREASRAQLHELTNPNHAATFSTSISSLWATARESHASYRSMRAQQLAWSQRHSVRAHLAEMLLQSGLGTSVPHLLDSLEARFSNLQRVYYIVRRWIHECSRTNDTPSSFSHEEIVHQLSQLHETFLRELEQLKEFVFEATATLFPQSNPSLIHGTSDDPWSNPAALSSSFGFVLHEREIEQFVFDCCQEQSVFSSSEVAHGDITLPTQPPCSPLDCKQYLQQILNESTTFSLPLNSTSPIPQNDTLVHEVVWQAIGAVRMKHQRHLDAQANQSASDSLKQAFSSWLNNEQCPIWIASKVSCSVDDLLQQVEAGSSSDSGEALQECVVHMLYLHSKMQTFNSLSELIETLRLLRTHMKTTLMRLEKWLVQYASEWINALDQTTMSASNLAQRIYLQGGPFVLQSLEELRDVNPTSFEDITSENQTRVFEQLSNKFLGDKPWSNHFKSLIKSLETHLLVKNDDTAAFHSFLRLLYPSSGSFMNRALFLHCAVPCSTKQVRNAWKTMRTHGLNSTKIESLTREIMQCMSLVSAPATASQQPSRSRYRKSWSRLMNLNELTLVILHLFELEQESARLTKEDMVASESSISNTSDSSSSVKSLSPDDARFLWQFLCSPSRTLFPPTLPPTDFSTTLVQRIRQLFDGDVKRAVWAVKGLEKEGRVVNSQSILLTSLSQYIPVVIRRIAEFMRDPKRGGQLLQNQSSNPSKYEESKDQGSPSSRSQELRIQVVRTWLMSSPLPPSLVLHYLKSLLDSALSSSAFTPFSSLSSLLRCIHGLFSLDGLTKLLKEQVLEEGVEVEMDSKGNEVMCPTMWNEEEIEGVQSFLKANFQGLFGSNDDVTRSIDDSNFIVNLLDSTHSYDATLYHLQRALDGASSTWELNGRFAGATHLRSYLIESYESTLQTRRKFFLRCLPFSRILERGAGGHDDGSAKLLPYDSIKRDMEWGAIDGLFSYASLDSLDSPVSSPPGSSPGSPRLRTKRQISVKKTASPSFLARARPSFTRPASSSTRMMMIPCAGFESLDCLEALIRSNPLKPFASITALVHAVNQYAYRTKQQSKKPAQVSPKSIQSVDVFSFQFQQLLQSLAAPDSRVWSSSVFNSAKQRWRCPLNLLTVRTFLQEAFQQYGLSVAEIETRLHEISSSEQLNPPTNLDTLLALLKPPAPAAITRPISLPLIDELISLPTPAVPSTARPPPPAPVDDSFTIGPSSAQHDAARRIQCLARGRAARQEVKEKVKANRLAALLAADEAKKLASVQPTETLASAAPSVSKSERITAIIEPTESSTPIEVPRSALTPYHSQLATSLHFGCMDIRTKLDAFLGKQQAAFSDFTLNQRESLMRNLKLSLSIKDIESVETDFGHALSPLHRQQALKFEEVRASAQSLLTGCLKHFAKECTAHQECTHCAVTVEGVVEECALTFLPRTLMNRLEAVATAGRNDALRGTEECYTAALNALKERFPDLIQTPPSVPRRVSVMRVRSIESPEEAAQLIQASFRQHQARKKQRNLGRPRPSKPAPDFIAPALHQAAAKIQAGIRGAIVRRRLTHERSAAVRIQSQFKGFRERRRFKAKKEKAANAPSVSVLFLPKSHVSAGDPNAAKQVESEPPHRVLCDNCCSALAVKYCEECGGLRLCDNDCDKELHTLVKKANHRRVAWPRDHAAEQAAAAAEAAASPTKVEEPISQVSAAPITIPSAAAPSSKRASLSPSYHRPLVEFLSAPTCSLLSPAVDRSQLTVTETGRLAHACESDGLDMNAPATLELCIQYLSLLSVQSNQFNSVSALVAELSRIRAAEAYDEILLQNYVSRSHLLPFHKSLSSVSQQKLRTLFPRIEIAFRCVKIVELGAREKLVEHLSPRGRKSFERKLLDDANKQSVFESEDVLIQLVEKLRAEGLMNLYSLLQQHVQSIYADARHPFATFYRQKPVPAVNWSSIESLWLAGNGCTKCIQNDYLPHVFASLLEGQNASEHLAMDFLNVDTLAKLVRQYVITFEQRLQKIDNTIATLRLLPPTAPLTHSLAHVLSYSASFAAVPTRTTTSAAIAPSSTSSSSSSSSLSSSNHAGNWEHAEHPQATGHAHAPLFDQVAIPTRCSAYALRSLANLEERLKKKTDLEKATVSQDTQARTIATPTFQSLLESLAPPAELLDVYAFDSDAALLAAMKTRLSRSSTRNGTPSSTSRSIKSPKSKRTTINEEQPFQLLPPPIPVVQRTSADESSAHSPDVMRQNSVESTIQHDAEVLRQQVEQAEITVKELEAQLNATHDPHSEPQPAVSETLSATSAELTSNEAVLTEVNGETAMPTPELVPSEIEDGKKVEVSGGVQIPSNVEVLPALSEAEIVEQTRAAIKLQKVERGRIARKKIAERRAEFERRKENARQASLRQQQNLAATRIQKLQRGHAVRKRMHGKLGQALMMSNNRLKAAITLQRYQRGRAVRQRVQRSKRDSASEAAPVIAPSSEPAQQVSQVEQQVSQVEQVSAEQIPQAEQASQATQEHLALQAAALEPDSEFPTSSSSSEAAPPLAATNEEKQVHADNDVHTSDDLNPSVQIIVSSPSNVKRSLPVTHSASSEAPASNGGVTAAEPLPQSYDSNYNPAQQYPEGYYSSDGTYWSPEDLAAYYAGAYDQSQQNPEAANATSLAEPGATTAAESPDTYSSTYTQPTAESATINEVATPGAAVDAPSQEEAAASFPAATAELNSAFDLSHDASQQHFASVDPNMAPAPSSDEWPADGNAEYYDDPIETPLPSSVPVDANQINHAPISAMDSNHPQPSHDPFAGAGSSASVMVDVVPSSNPVTTESLEALQVRQLAARHDSTASMDSTATNEYMSQMYANEAQFAQDDEFARIKALRAAQTDAAVLAQMKSQREQQAYEAAEIQEGQTHNDSQ